MRQTRTALIEAAAPISGTDLRDSVAFAGQAPRELNLRGYGIIQEHLDIAASEFSEVMYFNFEHDPKKIAGDVVPHTAHACPDGKARCEIEWYPENARIRAEILDSHRPNAFSCEYDYIRETRREMRSDGLHVWFACRFFGVSCLLTLTPADDSAGLYRSRFNMRNPTLADLLQIARSGTRDTGEDFSDVSLSEAILQVGERAASGRPREMFESITRIGGMPVDRPIPFSVIAPQRRDLTTVSGGAFIEPTMHDPTPLPFNKSVVRRAGATVITGLKGNFIKPRIASAPQPQALAETAAVTASDIMVDQAALTAYRISAQVVFPRLLLVQGGPAADKMIRLTTDGAISTAADRLWLFGQGANSEPTGLFNTAGVGSLLWDGAPTWAKVLEAEQKIADANLDGPTIAWAVSNATRATWKQTVRSATTAKFLVDDDGKCGEYPALGSSQLSGTHQSIVAAWDSVLILIWGDALAFSTTDPYTRASEDKIVLTVTAWANILPLYPAAVVVSADAANQS